MENDYYKQLEKELAYLEQRVLLLREERKGVLDNIWQTNISYEINFCLKKIEDLKSEINRFVVKNE